MSGVDKSITFERVAVQKKKGTKEEEKKIRKAVMTRE